MTVSRNDSLLVREERDVVEARRMIRDFAVALKFSLVDQTKLVTAGSELARNTVIYGGGGVMNLEALQDGIRVGLRMTFEDHGPGIADLALAMKDGYTTGSGLGLGLSGSKRLMNEFEIVSIPGKGTKITCGRWR